MRERSLDEFQSIFEQASIPVLDIEEVALTRVGAILKDDQLDTSILDLASYLKARFDSEIQVHWPAAIDAARLRDAARKRGLELADEPFASTAELVGQVSIGRSQLVLLPEPRDETARVVDLDLLVTGTAPPILIVRRPIGEPEAVFARILHGLTGSFQQTQNFSYSFTLAGDGGRLVLLHIIDDDEIQDVRGVLQVSPEIADETGEKLLRNLAHHGERYLKAVVAASRNRPFDVTYRLAVGDIITTVKEELIRGDYGLLVVGSHYEGHSHLAADDYQLMHQVRDIPVLAL